MQWKSSNDKDKKIVKKLSTKYRIPLVEPKGHSFGINIINIQSLIDHGLACCLLYSIFLFGR